LQVTTNRRATALATPAFPGCATCDLTVDVQTSGGSRSRIWIFGWYLDKDNRIEVIMQEKKDKWVLKQRSAGVVVAKKKGELPILPNTTYNVQVTFDGTTFELLIDGIPLFTMPKAPGSMPNGTVGFQVKDSTGQFGSIDVQ
jgi:hypothetical protein